MTLGEKMRPSVNGTVQSTTVRRKAIKAHALGSLSIVSIAALVAAIGSSVAVAQNLPSSADPGRTEQRFQPAPQTRT